MRAEYNYINNKRKYIYIYILLELDRIIKMPAVLLFVK